MNPIKKPDPVVRFFGDPAGTRTQDPYIKSVLLYRLSYEIEPTKRPNYRRFCN